MAATCIKQSSSPPSSPPGTSLRYSGGVVRALPVRIITVRKKRSRGVQLPIDEYMEKLKNFCSVHDGSTSLTFCIGDPYGHGLHLRQRADVTIRLSSTVMNHQAAIVVLLEQLYRTWTILKGQNYHH